MDIESGVKKVDKIFKREILVLLVFCIAPLLLSVLSFVLLPFAVAAFSIVGFILVLFPFFAGHKLNAIVCICALIIGGMFLINLIRIISLQKKVRSGNTSSDSVAIKEFDSSCKNVYLINSFFIIISALVLYSLV